MEPLERAKVHNDMNRMLHWMLEADEELSKYRLALEEIAAYTADDVDYVVQIAEEALK